MVDYLPRSAWGARASRGGTSLVASEVRGTALHWPGSTSTTPIGKDRIDDALRGWQDWHMDGRGWSDIAYQVAVDQWGRAWILRGLTVRSGANGDSTVNRQYGAILLILVKGEQPTEAMLSTARGVVADFRRHYPNGTQVKGHRDVRAEGTECPGPAAYAALQAGKFNPSSEPPPEDDMQLSDRVNVKGELAGQILGLDDISVDGALGYAASALVVAQQTQAQLAEHVATQLASARRIEDLFAAVRAEVAALKTEEPPA